MGQHSFSPPPPPPSNNLVTPLLAEQLTRGQGGYSSTSVYICNERNAEKKEVFREWTQIARVKIIGVQKYQCLFEEKGLL